MNQTKSINSREKNVNNTNVINVKKDNNYVNNVEDLTTDELLTLFEKRFIDEKEMKKYVADVLATSLSDERNIAYYLAVANKFNPSFLFECLSITKDAVREGHVRSTAAKFFVGVVKRKTADSVI